MLNRRETLGLGAAAAVAIVVRPLPAFAKSDLEDRIQKFTGGKTPEEGGIDFTTPEIAENGNTVPIKLTVKSPMTADNYVKRVTILADGNPNPDVVTFHFTPRSGEAAASTRMRLAKTQNVIAVAEMSDGSFKMVKNQVKVTIGGCGG